MKRILVLVCLITICCSCIAEATSPLPFGGRKRGTFSLLFGDSRTDDGSAIEESYSMEIPFRKFRRGTRYATLKTKKVFRYELRSEDFPQDATKEQKLAEYAATRDGVSAAYGVKPKETATDVLFGTERIAEWKADGITVRLTYKEPAFVWPLRIVIEKDDLVRLAKSEVEVSGGFEKPAFGLMADSDWSSRTDDGTACESSYSMKVAFRKFRRGTRYATLKTKKVFRYELRSEEFPQDATKEQKLAEYAATRDGVSAAYGVKPKETATDILFGTERIAEWKADGITVRLTYKEPAFVWPLRIVVEKDELVKVSRMEVKQYLEEHEDLKSQK